ncbi:uncharacterized protein RCC_07077 [Ramularia collo-cygni]|uniref:Uncharacterized protein n=1 Tax=Ramularia collo-cygni TaxID=112498 RepID=A0A2D3V3E5_9PEZI|nr:uncharacterized protein RCC_07077 [Ramularia collo-cygni]CZT21215.1 uncharacterized protein RCC_07077 [Ramularia collo-cygni]
MSSFCNDARPERVWSTPKYAAWLPRQGRSYPLESRNLPSSRVPPLESHASSGVCSSTAAIHYSSGDSETTPISSTHWSLP